MIFPKHDRSGVMPITLLRAAARQAESRHHLVKNQQRAVLRRYLPQKFQVARLGQIQSRVARHGFEDDARDLSGVGRERRAHRLLVIERQHHRMLRERRRHTRAVRIAKRQRARPRLHQQRIRMAVIAAVELDDFVALRETPRQPDGGHRRFRAGIAHPHFLHARHRRANQVRHLDFQRIRDAEARAIAPPPVAPPAMIFGCAWPRIAGPQVPT